MGGAAPQSHPVTRAAPHFTPPSLPPVSSPVHRGGCPGKFSLPPSLPHPPPPLPGLFLPGGYRMFSHSLPPSLQPPSSLSLPPPFRQLSAFTSSPLRCFNPFFFFFKTLPFPLLIVKVFFLYRKMWMNLLVWPQAQPDFPLPFAAGWCRAGTGALVGLEGAGVYVFCGRLVLCEHAQGAAQRWLGKYRAVVFRGAQRHLGLPACFWRGILFSSLLGITLSPRVLTRAWPSSGLSWGVPGPGRLLAGGGLCVCEAGAVGMEHVPAGCGTPQPALWAHRTPDPWGGAPVRPHHPC